MAVGKAWRLVISNEEDSLSEHSGKEKVKSKMAAINPIII